ncbi:MAG: S8 family peptidase [Pseudomonadota bacterium]
MADEAIKNLRIYDRPHVRIEAFKDTRNYKPPGQSMDPPSRLHERLVHGRQLSAGFSQAYAAVRQMLESRDEGIAAGRPGGYIEVETEPDARLPGLEWSSQGIGVGAVRQTDRDTTVGAVFVPTTAESFLSDKINEYGAGSPSLGLISQLDPIQSLGIGRIETLWSDTRPLPSPNEKIWWECWTPDKLTSNLVDPAEKLRLRVSEQRLKFPGVTIVPVYASIEEMTRLLPHTDALRELRHATDSPHIYVSDTAEFVDDLVINLQDRLIPAELTAPAVCLFDTGINRGHPLLEGSLDASDMFAIDDRWGLDDHYPGDGHGTPMAGAALLGDLTPHLASSNVIFLRHRLESVTYTPPSGFPATDPQSYGYITQSAISLPESRKPERKRIFCLATSNLDVSGERPTTWSAVIDQACMGRLELDDLSSEDQRRLMFVAGGNFPDAAGPEESTDHEAYPIEDPAQAWNALTIGGFTDRRDIAEPTYLGWEGVADVGDRSPYSRTSKGWKSGSPIKPDLCFEAGNRGQPADRSTYWSGIPSISSLSTGKDVLSAPVVPFWATSNAVGQAARMAAEIWAEHPELWPETIRALMVHSARWTPTMWNRIQASSSKRKHVQLVREFGYGVPSLERALQSAGADLALIAQTEAQPFIREQQENAKGNMVYKPNATLNTIDFYRLPWPTQTLQQIGNKLVDLRITLSYFIDPSPSQYAPISPAWYRSHGFRFDLRRSDETEENFMLRVNEAERGGQKPISTAADGNWILGSDSRGGTTAGSLHCDVWRGRAADLANRDHIAVYPVSGWWKERLPLKKFNERTRYALVATIACVEEDVDLHAEIMHTVETSTRPIDVST